MFVSRSMTRKVITIDPEADIFTAQELMSENRIRHLPVVEDGNLFGLISSRDVIASVVASKQDTIKYLECTIEELNEYLYSRT